MLWPNINHQSLIIWLCITLIMASVRLSLITTFKSRMSTAAQLLKWQKPYAITLFMVISNCGVGLLIIMPKDNFLVLLITTIFSIGLASSATSWHVPYIQVGTVCLALLPTIFVLLTYGQPEAISLGIAGTLLFLGNLFPVTVATTC